MTNKEAIYRQDVLDLAKKGVLISNGNYESVCKAINELPSVNPQPCEDAVSRDMALEKMADYVASGYADNVTDFEEYSRIICQLPAVKPQEPKIGHWIIDKDDRRKWDRYRFYCSECGKWQTYGKTKYCLHCGARMVEPQERSGEK